MEETFTREEKETKPTLQKWRVENPRRSINDYFMEYGTQTQSFSTPVLPTTQPPITYSYSTVNNTVIVGSTKSVFLSLVLTLLFGPIGLLYSSITEAVLMVLLDIAAFVALTGSIVSISALGESFAAIGLLGGLVWLVLIQWPLCILWGIVATLKHNRRLKSENC